MGIGRGAQRRDLAVEGHLGVDVWMTFELCSYKVALGESGLSSGASVFSGLCEG